MMHEKWGVILLVFKEDKRKIGEFLLSVVRVSNPNNAFQRFYNL